ncbi:L-seryl-tRNA(Sec) selenium transferase [Trichloromonas sp.]|uniref:L-seryl-tRNA(Sec) selenium transferase n=1 Tax=Trichloromonas sp. TaxID=3069249 RepID=UPI002A48BD77|nr:L-seryl-tRNA(Sec) selenium transferase [Trichloromonas sp.]
MTDKNLLLRQLPAVDRILNAPPLQALAATCPHVLLVEAAQETVAELRHTILSGSVSPDLAVDGVAELAACRAANKQGPSLRPVLNATGTLLHTNLGRAPLSEAALAAITAVSRSYSNLELDLTTGKRGHRFSHVEGLLCRLSGAEAAAVVNNNAGAVLLALTALAKGKEAIVSRGEMIEIGGAFRIPEVMEAGGVKLREVGTTNKTHLKDYAGAINAETGLLLKVHTSNYRIVGFTQEVPAAAMVELAHGHGLPVMEDLGSGMLMDLTPFGLPREPTVREAVAAGIDVVTFSGDKLLGGPQAGILVGRRTAIDKIRHHPLARALRIDKLTLAALEATLAAYLDEQRALSELPVLRMLNMTAAEVEERSRAFAERLDATLGTAAEISVIEEPSAIGGGALPLTELPGFAVALTPQGISVDLLALRLRQGKPPVVGRVQDNRLLLNLRTILPDEEPHLIEALRIAFRS